MPHTGSATLTKGNYIGICTKGSKHPIPTIQIDAGRTLPPCRTCHGPVKWTLVRPMK
jgi:hypothetical protein